MVTLFKPRIIKSVYFDTMDLKMFNDSEEGVLPRKKIRIRQYDNRSSFAIENKTSSIEGRFKVTSKLENYISESQLLTRNLFDAQYGNIRPSLEVSYERSYFTFNNMRITFDKNISYKNLNYANSRKHYDPERVIEIKTPLNCPDDYVEYHVPYPTTRFSKYSRGILLSMGGLCEV